jgi:pimeloyl-ACP methyl ester carboxylesterase
VKAGSGPALILLHTVRTQLDHFQLVIPKLVDAFTVFAVDMPGMGWSDITPGASYAEPALRRAIVEFVKALDLDDVTLAGESMGATVALTASTELEDRVRRILAFNTYDYPEGVSRANRVASIYIGGARLPAIGPVVAKMENTPALGIVLRGGLVDGSKLSNHYLAELRRVGRRRGYTRVAREVYRNADSMIAARALYGHVTAPVTLIYGDHDWSRPLSVKPTNRCYQAPERSRFLTPDTSPLSSSPLASPRSSSTTTQPDPVLTDQPVPPE